LKPWFCDEERLKEFEVRLREENEGESLKLFLRCGIREEEGVEKFENLGKSEEERENPFL
jgi:hypothetical protein